MVRLSTGIQGQGILCAWLTFGLLFSWPSIGWGVTSSILPTGSLTITTHIISILTISHVLIVIYIFLTSYYLWWYYTLLRQYTLN